MRGAPIRFVAAVIGGWICVRIAVLLPGDDPLTLAGDVLAPPADAIGRPTQIAAKASVRSPRAARQDGAVWHGSDLRLDAHGVAPGRSSAARASSTPLPDRAAQDRAVPSRGEAVQPVFVPAIVGPVSLHGVGSRWRASAWLLARGGANGTLSGGRLGASQAGVRVTYRIDAKHRMALAGRIAAPLRGRGTEAAIGIDWQPAAVPVHLVAEQRIGIDGARGGPTIMAYGGIAPARIAAGFRLEAYAQGGAILRSGRIEGFGDGAVRVARPLLRIGHVTLDAGVGAWGAGQPGAARIDLGPTAGASLPLARQTIRVSLDWRQRVAGGARPGSGPALSIGSDF